jgi:serine phosphatase RsbU (regulator of sigma subunit)
VFVFCSDGIFEAMNDSDEEFGARRVCEVVREYRHQAARRIVDAIFDSVTAFQRGAPRQDDMTAVAVKITGKGEIKNAV